MDIQSISTEDFIVSFNERMAFLGFKKKFKGIHFTLSFNADVDDMNFHVTRHGPDNNDKPKIVVAFVNKKSLETELLKFSKKLFGLSYQPFFFSKRQKQPITGYRPYFKYLSLTELESGPSADDFRIGIHSVFHKSAKLERRGRYRLNSNLALNFKQWVKRDPIKDIIKSKFTNLNKAVVRPIEIGYLTGPNYSGVAILIKGQIYIPREQVSLMTLANELWGIEITGTLIAKTESAILNIMKTENYAESVKFNDPLRIF